MDASPSAGVFIPQSSERQGISNVVFALKKNKVFDVKKVLRAAGSRADALAYACTCKTAIYSSAWGPEEGRSLSVYLDD